MRLTIVTGHEITRDESLLGRRQNSDAIASDWKAILGWVDKEGFSEEVTFKWGSGVRQILNSSEGEKGTQTKMTGRAKAPEARSSGEAGSQRPSRVAGS